MLRHAIAVERGTLGFKRDSERPLTEKGARRMRSVARGMRVLGIEFDIVLSSPYTRAKQTAEIVVKVFKCPEKLIFSENLICEGDSRALVKEIGSSYGNFQSVILVGHEPYLGEFMSVLLTGGGGLSVDFKKGGLCKLEVDSLTYGKCAVLKWMLTPSQMAGMR